jgi:hypothetical protein
MKKVTAAINRERKDLIYKFATQKVSIIWFSQ